MEIKLIHILGPVFATVAMFFYGRALVDRDKGRQVNIFPTLILIGGALTFIFFTANGTLLDRICYLLLDIGIAMIIDSRYLAYHRAHPKVFWVPGLLAVMISLGIWGTAWAFGWKITTMWQQPTTHALESKSGEILLELGSDDEINELEGLMEKYDATYSRAFPMISEDEDGDLAQFYLVDVKDGDRVGEFLSEANADDENIDDAALNGPMQLELPPSNPNLLSNPAGDFLANDPDITQQWWLQLAVANGVHEMLRDASPKRKAIVAIIDTGVDGDHPDLRKIFGKSPGDTDGHGHGTHCAGLAGASTNNGLGMASFNWEGRFIEIRGYQALGKNGQGTDYSVASAMMAAIEDGADVLSMSLGSNRPAPKVQREAVEYALRKRCIVVAAAGNDYGSDARKHSPVGVKGVIGVAAVGPDFQRTTFSNINTNLGMPIAAPGLDIFSTIPGGNYTSMSGTSMATPIVSGLIGVMRSIDPSLDAPAAWKILNETGRTGPSFEEVGAVIEPYAALARVLKR
ncbi:MAG: S8 family serine peptidase [Bacteroidetes bacterium]|nr:S8 family serine peptidase [Bacteroidota bacterium]